MSSSSTSFTAYMAEKISVSRWDQTHATYCCLLSQPLTLLQRKISARFSIIRHKQFSLPSEPRYSRCSYLQPGTGRVAMESVLSASILSSWHL